MRTEKPGWFFQKHLHRQKGQGLVEYSLIIALVALVAVVALSPLGKQIQTSFSDITSKIANAE